MLHHTKPYHIAQVQITPSYPKLYQKVVHSSAWLPTVQWDPRSSNDIFQCSAKPGGCPQQLTILQEPPTQALHIKTGFQCTLVHAQDRSITVTVGESRNFVLLHFVVYLQYSICAHTSYQVMLGRSEQRAQQVRWRIVDT